MAVGTLGGIASGPAQTSIASPATAISPPTTSGAKIRFAETVFDFGKVNGGEMARHNFVFTNTGSSMLEITDVRPGCGCTTAGAWDKTVEPGKTGMIPLQFNSTGFSGTVTKTATVTCNDPSQSNVVLQLKSTVWKAIDVMPAMAIFNVSSEIQTNETRVVRIVSNLEEPVELSDLQCTNRLFQTELKTVRPGKEFELSITAVPPFPSTPVNAAVTLKTSSTKMPTISASAYLMVQPAVTVMPGHILLPAGPLTNATQRVVTIRNTGTNSLVLSEPQVSVPGIEARVQEIQPGRSINLTIDFAAGFHTQPGQNVEVTVKSNHPKFPLIKVPVFQPPPPAARAATQSVPAEARVLPAKPEAPTTPGK
jgi:hypothetical protein